MKTIKGYLLLCLLLNFSAFYSAAQTDQDLLNATYYGGSDWDDFNNVVNTPDKGFVLVGSTSSYGISASAPHMATYGGEGDGLIVKMDSMLQIEWATYFGGSSDEFITAVDVLSDGSFVFAGSTSSDEGISTSDGFAPDYLGISTPFVNRFTSSGEQIWGTYLGGTEVNQPNIPAYFSNVSAIAVDGDDNIIVVGATAMVDFPVSEDAHQEIFAGERDGFISKFSNNGDLIWSTFFGGAGQDRIDNVQVISGNEIVVMGSTESSSGIASENAHQEEYGGEEDVFLARFTSNGNLEWSTYYGGSGIDAGNPGDLATDAEDNIYVRFATTSSSGITTPGAAVEVLSFPRSMALAQFSDGGELNWATYYGNHAIGSGGAITVSEDNLIVAGTARFDDNYLMGVPYQFAFYGNETSGDIYLLGFTTGGEQLWGTYYGGFGSDGASDVLSVGESKVLLVGGTNGFISMPETAIQPDFGGLVDGIMALFEISETVGVFEHAGQSLKVFPNPTTNQIRFQLPPEFPAHAQVTIYNMAGAQVLRHSSFNLLSPMPLNLSPGIYLVETKSASAVARTKVVVE